MRDLIVVGLLAWSGIAGAQTGGNAASIDLQSSTMNLQIAPTMTFVDLPISAPDFQIRFESSAQVFVLTNFSDISGTAAAAVAPLTPATPGMWAGDTLVTIEGEGMRLPEQRPDAVRRPLMPFDPEKP